LINITASLPTFFSKQACQPAIQPANFSQQALASKLDQPASQPAASQPASQSPASAQSVRGRCLRVKSA